MMSSNLIMDLRLYSLRGNEYLVERVHYTQALTSISYIASFMLFEQSLRDHKWNGYRSTMSLLSTT